MADTQGMNIGQASEQLVHVELDLEHRHGLLDLGIMARSAIHCLGDVFKHQVEENLFLLGQNQLHTLTKIPSGHSSRPHCISVNNSSASKCRALMHVVIFVHLRLYLLPVRVEKGLQIHNVGVRDQPHDLEFAILFRPDKSKERLMDMQCGPFKSDAVHLGVQALKAVLIVPCWDNVKQREEGWASIP